MEALREHNLQTDAEKVRQLFDEYRAGGLAVVAWKDTVKAIEQGQVDEVLLSASAQEIRTDEAGVGPLRRRPIFLRSRRSILIQNRT